MMKKIVLNIALIYCITALNAQPTIPFDEMTPVDGMMINLSESEVNLNPGAEGPGQQWDFTLLTASFPTSFEFQVVDQQPGSNQFPESTHVITDNNLSFFQYFTFTSDTASINGSVIEVLGDFFVSRFPDPIKWYEFPLSFESSFEDVYTTEDAISGLIMSRSEVINLVDAYGTLLLPSGSVNDVLRIKRDRLTANYSYDVEGNPSDTSFTTGVQYDYVSSGYPYPLVSISILEGDTSVSFATDLLTNIGEAERTGEVRLYPNPSQIGRVFLSSLKTVERIRVFDLNGKCVHQEDRTSPDSNGKTTIELSHLRPGIYIVEISTNGTFIRKKLSIAE